MTAGGIQKPDRTGSSQLPTRFLRKRLEVLREIFPPPEGFALFPEELRD